MRIGVLTAGGDCSGLNAAIAEAVDRLESNGASPVLIPKGFAGLIDGVETHISRDNLFWASRRGGTVLGSTRTKVKSEESVKAAASGATRLGIDGLLVIGGDGSLQGAAHLAATGLTVVGVPKTIDADVGFTDTTIGFATAVQIGCESVERIDDTRRSHHGLFLVEVMGRRSGILAASIARAAGASVALVPEAEWSLDALVRRLDTPNGGLVVVSESAWSAALGPQPRAENGKPVVGGVVDPIAAALRTSGFTQVRTTTLGHSLRGGPPVASDRTLARSLAARAVAEVIRSNSAMIALCEGRVCALPVSAAEAPRRFLTPAEIEELGPLVLRD